MKMKGFTRWSTAGSLGLVLASLAWTGGCGAPDPKEDPLGNGAYEPPPINVSTLELEPGELTERLVLTGRIEPWVAVNVSAELGGTVLEVGFEKGQRVEKGRVLARVGTDLLSVELEEAKAALVEAEANYNKTKELFARQAVPRQELIAYTSRYEAAKARVALAELRLERSIIRAPVSGVAISREVEFGEVISPGARITTLHELSRLKVSVGVPENEVPFFREGGAATLEVDAYPGKVFEGRIHFLGPAATGQNRTFPSEVAIENPGGELRPGMIARVSLVKRHFDRAIVVPRDALLERDEGTMAFVRVDDHAEERQVVLGPGEGDRVVVLEGLAAGESLIVRGHRNMVDGQPIRVVN